MLDFETLKRAWNILKKQKVDKLQELLPALTDPDQIYIKRINEDNGHIVVQFTGLDKSTNETIYIPQIKRIIVTWVRKFSSTVQIMRSEPWVLILKISKTLTIEEASVQVFKRLPNNKIQKYHKCIGGKKDGRRVSDPNNCLGVPDWNKKMQFSINKRSKYGQVLQSKTKTKLTNIVSKRVRKANARLKKARGF